MFLKDLKVGESRKIKGMWLSERVKHRLESLGMTKGTEVQVVNKKTSGAMVIKVRGTRFAIGKDFSQGIAVEDNKNEE